MLRLVFKRFVAPCVDWLLKESRLLTFIVYFLERRIVQVASDEGLRILFKLENIIYSMEGRLSVIYGGGLHTKHRHMNYHDFFASRIDKGDRVLDVGCGNGAVAHTVAQKTGARIVGIDLLEENIAAAKHKHDHPKVRYVVGDVLQVIPEGEFTVVVLSNVLEHLPRRPEFLSSMVRHTGVNRVLIRVPLFERDWRVPLKKELGIEWRLDTTHETEYTMEEFLEEMELAGLFVVHHEVRWGEIWAEVEASHA